MENSIVKCLLKILVCKNYSCVIRANAYCAIIFRNRLRNFLLAYVMNQPGKAKNEIVGRSKINQFGL